MKDRVCIIGSGISGLVSAHILHQKYDIEILEAQDYIGGHTNTEDVVRPDGSYRVNTGFIVFNKENYPNFIKLISKFGIEYQPSSMSFSVKCSRTGLEYGFETFNAIFAQRKNIFSPSFLRMLLEISKFQKQFDTLLDEKSSEAMSIGEYLVAKGYSQKFLDQFIFPFAAAIWSAESEKVKEFPLRTFIQFFKNHGFLAESEILQWYTLKNGSASYVAEVTKPFADRIRLETDVNSVKRVSNGVEVKARNGFVGLYDKVLIAAHSDQALDMLVDATEVEKSVLGAMKYQPNDVVLHYDASLLPAHKQTWSSWNYFIPKEKDARCTVSYDMNILQSIKSKDEFIVTLNQPNDIDPNKHIKSFVYDHPVYTVDSVKAQQRYDDINGVDRIYYAGAYWGYGFHEDGVKSAMRACAAIDATIEL